jgi:hypothetical protein
MAGGSIGRGGEGENPGGDLKPRRASGRRQASPPVGVQRTRPGEQGPEAEPASQIATGKPAAARAGSRNPRVQRGGAAAITPPTRSSDPRRGAATANGRRARTPPRGGAAPGEGKALKGGGTPRALRPETWPISLCEEQAVKRVETLEAEPTRVRQARDARVGGNAAAAEQGGKLASPDTLGGLARWHVLEEPGTS